MPHNERPPEKRDERSGETRDERRKPDRGRNRVPGKVQGGALRGALWGRHASAAALANPDRHIRRILCTAGARRNLDALLTALPGVRQAPLPEPEVMESDALAGLLPKGAVHQGLVLVADPLAEVGLEDILAASTTRPDLLLVMLDQVTDPHNVGAILRSAAAFGAAGVIVQKRHSPAIDGVLAKSASGALEHAPLIPVVNLTRALTTLADHGVWRLGLAEDCQTTITEAIPAGAGTAGATGARLCLVLGAEGAGLRRLVRETCDEVVRLPTAASFSALNVSNAAAIALYEARRPKPVS